MMMRPAFQLCMLMLALLATSSYAAAAQLKMQNMEHHATDKDHDGKADEGEDHDTSFDHEMFLGKEGSQEFSGLQAEEGKAKLGALFDSKIDANKDGKADKQELINWMHTVAEEHVKNELEQNWLKFNKTADKDQLLTWPEYTAYKMQGALTNVNEKHAQSVLKTLQATNAASLAKSGVLTFEAPPKEAGEDAKSQQEALAADVVRDSLRWAAADGDKDGKLSKAELHQFYYPDDFPHMREVLVQESLDHADKDRDGKVSMAEFMADMWNPTKDHDEKEPEWVAEERKSFMEVKDKNKDGFLDRKEFNDYMFSHENEKAELYKREADHLVSEADGNKDGALDRNEIVNNLELFAGSAATNYGDHIGLREDL